MRIAVVTATVVGLVVAAAPTVATAGDQAGTARDQAGTAGEQGRHRESWRVDVDSVGGDVVGVAPVGGRLRVVAPERTTLTDGRPGGMYTFGVHRAAHAVDEITVTPVTSGVTIEVRTRQPGRGWSEWRAAAPTASLPYAGREVQPRAVFTDPAATLGDFKLRAVDTGRAAVEDRGEPLTYRVYATREGLVGGTTANGHKIVKNDRFVALPSRRALASDGGNEYTVTVRYQGRSVTAPVWDVGPWNTKDDYWSPAAERQRFQDLPRGTPEAQAAYRDGYNGGKDGFGRTVRNPAGIDLADGTFWHDLKMTDNDWVEVTYNWTKGDGAWSEVVDDATEGRFTSSDAWRASSHSGQRYGTGYRYAAPALVDDPAWFRAEVPEAGDYEVWVWYPTAPDYNPATPFLVRTAEAVEKVAVDQRSSGGTWVSLGVFPLAAGEHDTVGVSTASLEPGYVVADAIKLTRA
ncbi:MAG: hypothetical protein ACRDTM_07230 [Micromonosporaceae bacterium]